MSSVTESGNDVERPRILVISLRELRDDPARACSYELEDTVAQLEGVELFSPRYRASGETFGRRLARALQKRTGVSIERLPVVERTQVPGSYDMLFFLCQTAKDLTVLERIRGWRESCRVAVCWVEELWVERIPWYPREMDLLRQFDRIFCSCWASARELSRLLSPPCEYLAPGVDALRFCPHPGEPPRTIDILSIGRRSDATHRALLDFTRSKGWFYVYDTFKGSRLLEPGQHRQLLASMIQRSRFFIANRAKINKLEQTFQQEEIGFRFFEGAAGGAVMVGDPPRCDPYEDHFGWPDAVMRLPYDTTDVASAFEEMDAQPDRMERIRRDNLVNSLLRHDWIYRWSRVLDSVDLPEPRRASERKMELERRAQSIAGRTKSSALHRD